MSPSTDPMAAGRMVQLDALRAFAIAGVLVHHFAPGSVEYFPFGAAGVKLFFVLSGFLITGILLRYRDDIDSGRATVGNRIRTFYLRRFLRIFPVYYFALFLTLALGCPPVRETFWWHALYLTNAYIAVTGDWPGYLSPFWTLAVEEQFYLVWPWVVLFTPRRRLAGVCVGVVLTAIATRAVGVWAGFDPSRVGVLPVACLDTLGLGALLAVVARSAPPSSRPTILLPRVGFWLGLPLGVVLLGLPHVEWLAELRTILQDTAMGLVSTWLVARSASGFGGVVGRFLELRVLTRVGLISYGIYVCHSFAPDLVITWLNTTPAAAKLATATTASILGLVLLSPVVRPRARRLGITLEPQPVVVNGFVTAVLIGASYAIMRGGMMPVEGMNVLNRFILSVSFSVLAAEVSWQLFEGPINRLKRQPGSGTRPPSRPDSVAATDAIPQPARV